MKETPTPLVPAKVGTRFSSRDALIFVKASILRRHWITAFAGMSGEKIAALLQSRPIAPEEALDRGDVMNY